MTVAVWLSRLPGLGPVVFILLQRQPSVSRHSISLWPASWLVDFLLPHTTYSFPDARASKAYIQTSCAGTCIGGAPFCAGRAVVARCDDISQPASDDTTPCDHHISDNLCTLCEYPHILYFAVTCDAKMADCTRKCCPAAAPGSTSDMCRILSSAAACIHHPFHLSLDKYAEGAG